MRGKKILCLVCMLALVMLVSAGCKKKPEEPEDTTPEVEETQKDYVEKALKEIEKTMTADGDIAKQKKVKRSLAKHILKDHAALMALFQSKQFDAMAAYLGSAQVYKEKDENGNPIWYEGDMSKFWNDLYDEKVNTPGAVSIELEIYADNISLKDFTSKQDEQDDVDCESTEVFLFRIIALDENGNVISNQDGGGERDRRHSGPCPWV